MANIPPPGDAPERFVLAPTNLSDTSLLDGNFTLTNSEFNRTQSSSYTFLQIKSEPCQVSEITTSDGLNQRQLITEPMSSALTTVVKIEASSPQTSVMDKSASITSNSGNIPVGIAVARKRTQDQNTTIPRDCFGIHLNDSASSEYAGLFYERRDLPVANTESLGSTQSFQNIGRTSSSFWQYPNTVPIEPVFSMPVQPSGFQYGREMNRGQLLLLPATPANLDPPFQQTFVWPTYLHPGSMPTAPNYLHAPSAPPSQATPFLPFQFYGSNYLAAATGTTLHQHTQSNGAARFLALSTAAENKRIAVEKPNLMGNNNLDDNGNENAFVKSFMTSTNEKPKDRKIGRENIAANVLSYQLEETQSVQMNEGTSVASATSVCHSSSTQSIAIINQSASTSFANAESNSITNGLTYKQPDMQDVNIQTDTPVASEDENTIDTEETLTGFSANEQNGCNQVALEEPPNNSETPPCCKEPPSTCTDKWLVECKEDVDDIATDLSQGPKKLHSLPNYSDIPIDLTGLELLSNISTKAMGNKLSLKQETLDEPIVSEPHFEPVNSLFNRTSVDREEFGGLNLLCALAEQRIHEEEVEIEEAPKCNELVKFDCSPPPSTSKRSSKKKKRKHAKSKSSKKHKYHKSKKRSRSHKTGDREQESNESADGAGGAGGNSSDDGDPSLDGAFNKIKEKFLKKKTCDAHASDKSCCRGDKCNWPNPEEWLKAIESDMRCRLADIARQYRKKKRKLNAVNRKQKEANVNTSGESIKKIKKKKLKKSKLILDFKTSPSFTHADRIINSSIPSTDDMRINTGRCISMGSTPEMTSSGIKIAEVTNISTHFSFIDNKSETKVDNLLFTTTKQEISFDNSGKSKKKSKALIPPFKEEIRTIEGGTPRQEHHSKKLDLKLTITGDHLYQQKTRILTEMGGLFYAGYLSPLQPPDVYAITLDGERGNKPHIMSREEVLKDTILEVSPSSVSEVPAGTRICAYWSQQYRCLYPGRASKTDLPDNKDDKAFISVEFDDGDSGRIRLQNIRFLLNDYPIVEYDSNPLESFKKHKDLTQNEMEGRIPKIEQEIGENARAESRQRIDSDNSKEKHDEFRKHKKHKKKKKHKIRRHLKAAQLLAAPTMGVVAVSNGDESQKHIFNNVPVELSEKIPETTHDGIDQAIEDDNSCQTDNTTQDSQDMQTTDRNLGAHSKIAAFLPTRQLWNWLGPPYKKVGHKGRSKKQFFKSIQRGKEVITVGDSAVFLSTGRPDRPYIGRIDSMWESSANNKVVRVKWFYHPEETYNCPNLKFPGGLFESPHVDENDVQTISHKCEVLNFNVYEEKFGPDPEQYGFIYDNNDTYYQAGSYNPKAQTLTLNNEVPIETEMI